MYSSAGHTVGGVVLMLLLLLLLLMMLMLMLELLLLKLSRHLLPEVQVVLTIPVIVSGLLLLAESLEGAVAVVVAADVAGGIGVHDDGSGRALQKQGAGEWRLVNSMRMLVAPMGARCTPPWAMAMGKKRGGGLRL